MLIDLFSLELACGWHTLQHKLRQLFEVRSKVELLSLLSYSCCLKLLTELLNLVRVDLSQ